MDERDLEPEETAVRLLVDQLDAPIGETPKFLAKVVHLVGDVVHPGPAVGEELADGRLLAERPEQLDTALADTHGDGLHALLGKRVAALDLAAEEALIRVDRLVQVVDRNAEMMDPLRVHAKRMLAVATAQAARERA